jgi:hypothetical protein
MGNYKLLKKGSNYLVLCAEKFEEIIMTQWIISHVPGIPSWHVWLKALPLPNAALIYCLKLKHCLFPELMVVECF